MIKRFFIVAQLLVAIVFACAGLAGAQAGDPLPAALPEAGTANDAVTQESGRYTAEEFDALSDADKQDVYLHQPQKLPDNFSPIKYPLFMQAE